MTSLAHFLPEAFHLGGQVLLLYVLSAFVGFGLVVAFLPAFFRSRWVLVAPLAGVAFHAVITTPLAVLGFPVQQIFWCPFAIALLLNAYAVFQAKANLRRHLGFAYLRSRLARLLSLAVVVVLVCTYLVTSRNTSSVDDLWGSSDFFDYWVMADYSQNYGSNMEAYRQQSEYESIDVVRHLTDGARLGVITVLSSWSAVVSPRNTYKILTAAIVTGILSWIWVLQLFLDRHRIRALWPMLLVAVHPLLYCLLYFSYFSQTTCLPIAVVSFIVLEDHISRCMRGRSHHRQGFVAGVLLGSNLLSYAAMAVPIFMFILATGWRFFKARFWRTRSWKGMLVPACTAFAVCFYYLPHPIRELLFVNAQKVQGGWNWQGLVGFPELFGVASLLGYFLPVSTYTERVTQNVILGIVFLVLFWAALKHLRLRVTVFAVAFSTLCLLGLSASKILAGIANANHGFFKILSQFGPLLFIITLIGLASLLRGRIQSGVMKGVLLFALIGWVFLEWRAVAVGADQRYLFRAEAVELVRDELKDTERVCMMFDRFGWWSPNIHEAMTKRPERFVLRSSDELLQRRGPAPRFIYDAELGQPSGTPRRSGSYFSGKPPSRLSFSDRPAEMAWIQRGQPWFKIGGNRSCVVIMAPATSRLQVAYSATQPDEPTSGSNLQLDFSINGVPCGRQSISSGNGLIDISVPNSAQGGAYSVIECSSTGSREYQAAVVLLALQYE